MVIALITLDCEKIKEVLIESILSIDDSLLLRFPITNYLEMLDRYPRIGSYEYVSREVKYLVKSILDYTNKNTDLLELYHKLLLSELIDNNEVDRQELPLSIKKLYSTNFQRILQDISSHNQPIGFYLYPNDKFLKDLAICTQRLIPVGSRKLVVKYCPKRFILQNGIRQAIRGLFFRLFKIPGISPLVFEMHMDSHDPSCVAEYTSNGYIRSCLCVADLMESQKDIKGIYGTSWFYDPKLEMISPRLNYIRKVFTDNGGAVFYLGPSESAKADALAKSPTRNRLYREGKYIPTDYLIIWSRNDLLRWARQFRKDNPEIGSH